MKLSKDGWGGLAVLAASLLLFGLTLELRQNPLVPIGPGFYPRIVLGLTAILAAALVVFDLARRKPAAAARGPTDYAAVALHFAIFGVYVAALPWLGFAVMDPPRRWSGWLRAGAIAAGAVLVTYVAFERYLLVLLPRGRWTDF
ncbi:MAG: hypothetical protein K0R40_2024 [Burkholderiales bacterium]|nr:hypothetical protein [Burkholderiales bacterium]